MKIKQEKTNMLAGYRERRHRWIAVTLLLGVLVVVLAALMLLAGNTWYSPRTIVKILSGANLDGA